MIGMFFFKIFLDKPRLSFIFNAGSVIQIKIAVMPSAFFRKMDVYGGYEHG